MSEPWALKILEKLVIKGSIVRMVQWSGGKPLWIWTVVPWHSYLYAAHQGGKNDRTWN